jgi:hypothetical protein
MAARTALKARKVGEEASAFAKATADLSAVASAEADTSSLPVEWPCVEWPGL